MRKSLKTSTLNEKEKNKIPIILCDVKNLYRSILQEIIEKYICDNKIDDFYIYNNVVTTESLKKNSTEILDFKDIQSITILANVGKEISIIVNKIKYIKEILPNSKIIVISETENKNHLYRCILNGVVGYLLADVSVTALVDCVRLVANGQTVYPSHLFKFNEIYGEALLESRDRKFSDIPSTMNAKQIKILAYLASGLSNKEISNSCGE